MSASPLLFDDVFEVNEVDPDGKKFTKGTQRSSRHPTAPPGQRSPRPRPRPRRDGAAAVRALVARSARAGRPPGARARPSAPGARVRRGASDSRPSPARTDGRAVRCAVSRVNCRSQRYEVRRTPGAKCSPARDSTARTRARGGRSCTLRPCTHRPYVQVDLVLDVNSELCKLAVKDTFKLVLATTLSLNEGRYRRRRRRLRSPLGTTGRTRGPSSAASRARGRARIGGPSALRLCARSADRRPRPRPRAPRRAAQPGTIRAGRRSRTTTSTSCSGRCSSPWTTPRAPCASRCT